MTRAQYCALLRRGVINQSNAIRGFRALAVGAPTADARDLMLLLARYARANRRALNRQLARYCVVVNGVVVNGNGIVI